MENGEIVSYEVDGKTDDFNYNVVDWWACGNDLNATIQHRSRIGRTRLISVAKQQESSQL